MTQAGNEKTEFTSGVEKRQLKFMCGVLDSIIAQTSLNKLSLFSQV